jgi:hypothetical protein
MPAISEGCWFWIDLGVPEGERCMSALCDNCRCKNHPGEGSYYDFEDGVGPWDITCSECNDILWKHIPPEDEIAAEIDQIFEQHMGGEHEEN